MNIYSVNKLIIAVLAAILLFAVVRAAGERLFPDKPAGEPAYVIDLEDQTEAPPTPAAEPAPTDAAAAEPDISEAVLPAPLTITALIAQSDPAAGEKQSAICKACHNFAKGGPSMIGPNLWNIVTRKKAAAAGYAYSPAFQSLSGAWTYEDLDAFLENPGQFAPGTKMSFAGVKDPKNRAAIIAYLRLQADAPAPPPAE